MALWLAKEFDWDTGNYTGKYYDIAEAGIVAVFVDSKYGDNANDGTDPDTPYKDLNTAIAYLNTNGAYGSRIFMNGIFTGSLTPQTYAYRFIGCGGGRNGRTVFVKNIINDDRPLPRIVTDIVNIQCFWENVELQNYQMLGLWGTSNLSFRIGFLNCILADVTITCFENAANIYGNNASYYTVYKNAASMRTDVRGISVVGERNTFFDCINNGTQNIRLPATNCHANNDFIVSTYGVQNLLNINGEYIDPATNNFSVRVTSPLIFGGTYNENTGLNNHVGAGSFGLIYNGLSDALNDDYGAIYSNVEKSQSGIITLLENETTGSVESTIIDLGNYYPITNINIHNVYDYLDGEITEGIHEAFSSPRMALTMKIKYGLTAAEANDCPWLLIEYGKRPTYSGSGVGRVGNADDTFDPDEQLNITARYLKLFLTFNGQA